MGHPGLVQIQANQIRLTNNGAIGSVTTSTDPAADIVINAETIQIQGSPLVRNIGDERSFTGIASVAGSRLFNQVFNIPGTGSFGSSGNIDIKAQQLDITSGSIATGNLGQGNAGKIVSDIERVNIERSLIYSGAASGNGGGIRLNSQRVQAFDSALLVSSDGQGVGGNITINSSLILSLNNFLSASSVGNTAGRVQVNADQLLLDRQTQAIATSGLGAEFDGQIITNIEPTSIRDRNVNRNQSLVASNIAITCASQFETGGAFKRTAQGGIANLIGFVPIGWQPGGQTAAAPASVATQVNQATGWEVAIDAAGRRRVSFVATPTQNGNQANRTPAQPCNS
ncbi:MAG: hypothetical protein HC805_04115 [Alkalinema sp. RL_2_19]|nr:hypothetical protein [Alkalinema sp. RL_2_19]